MVVKIDMLCVRVRVCFSNRCAAHPTDVLHQGNSERLQSSQLHCRDRSSL